jgi:hypothetical protein
MFNKFFPLIILVLFLSTLGCATVQNPKVETDAVDSAKAWLNLIDERKYVDSWKESSEVLRKAVTPQDWQRNMAAARKQLGAVVSREVKSHNYRKHIRGAPKGQYVIIQFITDFYNKKSSIETVTPMLETDGKWRVAGYFIN